MTLKEAIGICESIAQSADEMRYIEGAKIDAEAIRVVLDALKMAMLKLDYACGCPRDDDFIYHTRRCDRHHFQTKRD